MEHKKDTVGQLAVDLQNKPYEEQSPIDIQRAAQANFEEHFFLCVARGKQMFEGDFYVMVETKRERLLNNVIRNFFYPRLTAPTPTYDQAVYKYHRAQERVDFLWVLPSKETCELFRDNALHIAKEEKELLGFILAFYDGSLLTKAKKLNGEQEDSPLLEKR